jgi:AcrR family transcriptional regulator
MADTPKGRATRARILDAAWQLSDARGAEGILGGVTLREIAAAVDMAPSAVAYHFPTTENLAVAMTAHLLDGLSPATIDAIDALVDYAESDGFANAARLAAQLNWQALTSPGEVTFERRLVRCYGAAPSHDGIRRMLADAVEGWVDEIAETYGRTAELLHLRPIEPFQLVEIARAMSALTEGLLQFWMLNPDAVRTDLVEDVVVALASAAVIPGEREVALEERAAGIPGGLPGEPPDATADLKMAERAAPLFAAGVEHVTFTEAARRIGIDPGEAADRFGSVPLLAAMSFGRHVPVVAESVDRRRDAGPAVSLTDGVYELGRCALADRHTAVALLHERHRAAVAVPAPPPERDVRELVALTPLFAEPLGQLLQGSQSEAIELADLLTDSVLCQAATRPRTPVANITETALRLVPFEF